MGESGCWGRLVPAIRRMAVAPSGVGATAQVALGSPRAAGCVSPRRKRGTPSGARWRRPAALPPGPARWPPPHRPRPPRRRGYRRGIAMAAPPKRTESRGWTGRGNRGRASASRTSAPPKGVWWSVPTRTSAVGHPRDAAGRGGGKSPCARAPASWEAATASSLPVGAFGDRRGTVRRRTRRVAMCRAGTDRWDLRDGSARPRAPGEGAPRFGCGRLGRREARCRKPVHRIDPGRRNQGRSRNRRGTDSKGEQG